MSEGRVQRRKMIKDLKHEEWLWNLHSCPGEEQTKGRQIASFEFLCEADASQGSPGTRAGRVSAHTRSQLRAIQPKRGSL